MNKKVLLGMGLALASGVAFAQFQGGARGFQGSYRGGVQIQGNTRINANAKNTSAVAVGMGNKAENAVGVIGGH